MFGKLKRKKKQTSEESLNDLNKSSDEPQEENKEDAESEGTGKADKTKKKAKKEKKIDKNILKAINILDFTKDGAIKTTQGYMDIVEIDGKDIFSLRDEEIHRDISIFHSFYKVTGADIKIVTMKFPVNTETQKSYVLYKIEKSDNPIHKKFLKNKLSELEFLEKNRSNKEHYLFIFSEKEDNLKSTKKTAIRVLQNTIKVRDITLDKKTIILKKLYNQNSKIDQNLKIEFTEKGEKS